MSMQFEPVIVTIYGKHNSGKTTLARLIELSLQEYGYKLVSVRDAPPLPSSQKPEYDERRRVNMTKREVRIVVECKS